MKLTRHLTEREVLDLHARTIAQHGGAPGVRDLGLLQSSLYRARSGYYESLSEQAAALLQSFCMNHPFVDGNKRVALLVTAVFLRMNGFRLGAKSPEFVRFILNEVISKKADVPAIAKWLERWMEQD
jgi:death-on-curing protein